MRAALAMLSAAGLGRGLPLRADWRGAVLMMHRVRPAGTGAFRPNRHLEITPGFLDDVLERLSQMRIPVVCLEEAADRLARGCTDRFAALTFDDGYRDNLVHAAPVMRRHGVPFTVFVATGMVDASANAWWMTLEEIVAAATTTDARPAGCGLLDTRDAKRKTAAFDTLVRAMWRFDEPGRDRAVREMADRHGHDIPAMLRREMMCWDEVRALASDPLCRIGGHTVSHPALAMLPEEAARREIAGGLDRIEAETGVRPRVFAYPYGNSLAVGPREEAIVADLGLRVAVTTSRGLLGPGAAGSRRAWPRLSLNGELQTLREFDVLMTGVPFALASGAARLSARLRGRPVLRAAS